MASLGDRTTLELMVLALTVTICLSLLMTGASIVVIELVHPEADTSSAIAGLSSSLSMILGALLGLLAGRGERVAALADRPPP